MIESNDGGANVSFNGGRSWSEQDQPTAQFYRVALDNDFPYHDYVLVGTTDNRECFKKEDRPAFIKQCVEIANGRPLIFKLHPNEIMGRAISEIKEFAPENALIYTEGNINPMIANCEEFITQYSSSVYVGLALGKKVHSYFDLDELKGFNARLLHQLPYAAVADRLAALGIRGGETFWMTARPNIAVFADISRWWAVVSADITPLIEDSAFTAKAAGLLPPQPWNEATWAEWTNAIKAATGAKGRALFHPLRAAITGQDTGPDMKSLLPLIDEARVRARLAGNVG